MAIHSFSIVSHRILALFSQLIIDLQGISTLVGENRAQYIGEIVQEHAQAPSGYTQKLADMQFLAVGKPMHLPNNTVSITEHSLPNNKCLQAILQELGMWDLQVEQLGESEEYPQALAQGEVSMLISQMVGLKWHNQNWEYDAYAPISQYMSALDQSISCSQSLLRKIDAELIGNICAWYTNLAILLRLLENKLAILAPA